MRILSSHLKKLWHCYFKFRIFIPHHCEKEKTLNLVVLSSLQAATKNLLRISWRSWTRRFLQWRGGKWSTWCFQGLGTTSCGWTSWECKYQGLPPMPELAMEMNSGWTILGGIRRCETWWLVHSLGCIFWFYFTVWDRCTVWDSTYCYVYGCFPLASH